MAISPGAAGFRLQYGISPIVMTGGIASSIPGGILPVLSISNAISFIGGVLGFDETPVGIDDFFAYFQPLPGGTLIDQQIGMYPFANQTIAANATIQQPLTISMLMICPAGAGGGYATKAATIQSIQNTFNQHNTSGGLYTILTPSFPYTDCIMTAMTDVSSGQTKQVQNAFKIDFLQPLVSLAAAAQAQNALMSQIGAGVPTPGAQTGLTQAAGNNLGSQGPNFLNVPGQGATNLSTGSASPLSTLAGSTL